MSEALRDQLSSCLSGFTPDQLALLAHVSRDAAICARAARPVSADAFIRLCVAVTFDPAQDLQIGAQPVIGAFDHKTLGMGMRVARGLRKHNIRAGAKASGLSVTTLSRIENGRPASIVSTVKACRYIGAHPFGYVVSHVKRHPNSLKGNVCSARAMP